jgi:hypothetical protein
MEVFCQFDVGDPYCCSIDELERKKTHRAAVATYLRDQHRRHFGRQSIYEDGPEFSLGPANTSTEDYKGFAADMGMKGIDGLKPPTLALPQTPDPLHLAERQFQPKLRVMISPYADDQNLVDMIASDVIF